MAYVVMAYTVMAYMVVAHLEANEELIDDVYERRHGGGPGHSTNDLDERSLETTAGPAGHWLVAPAGHWLAAPAGHWLAAPAGHWLAACPSTQAWASLLPMRIQQRAVGHSLAIV